VHRLDPRAVLWVAGADVPAGLKLALPSGRRMPLPAVTSSLPETPAYFVDRANGVVIDSVVAARPAASVYAEVLERALFRDLRQEGGISYTASAAYEARGDGFAQVVAAVDALPEKRAAAVGGVIDTLAALQAGRIDESDIAAYIAQVKTAAGHPDAEAARLGSASFGLLVGQPIRDVDETVAGLAGVTAADVHAVAIEARETALLQVPSGHTADWAGFALAPVRSAGTIDGDRRLKAYADGPDLILGVDGIMAAADDCPVTIRFDQVSVMWAWPDGARKLVGHDGFVLSVEPTLNAVDPAAISRLDAAVPAHLVIRMPARDPNAVPRPKGPGPATPVQSRPRGPAKTWQIVLAILLGVAAGVVGCLAGLLGLGALTDDGSESDIGWGPAVVMSMCALVFLVPAIWLLVRVIRRK